jgi:hypothetical protein
VDQKIGDKLTVRASHGKRRVRFQPGNERVGRVFSPAGLVLSKHSATTRRRNELRSSVLPAARPFEGAMHMVRISALPLHLQKCCLFCLLLAFILKLLPNGFNVLNSYSPKHAAFGVQRKHLPRKFVDQILGRNSKMLD